jgi:hypothetical protein
LGILTATQPDRIEREAREALEAEKKAAKSRGLSSQHSEGKVQSELPAAPATPQRQLGKRKQPSTPETPVNDDEPALQDPSACSNEKGTPTPVPDVEPLVGRSRKRANTSNALKLTTPKKKATLPRNASYSHPAPERSIAREEIEAWASGPMQKMAAMSEKKVNVVGLDEAVRLDVEAGSPERKKRRRR